MSRLAPAFWARPFAHRGLHNAAEGRIENSVSAVRAAVQSGYGIEVDVQPSADGEAMVFHDYTLNRLTGRKGRIDGFDADALSRIPLLSGERIPTLTDVLIAAGGAPILIEIKDQTGGYGESDGILELRVAEVIRECGGPNCAVMSFNPFSVAHIRDAFSVLPRGIVAYDFEHPHDASVAAAHRQRLAELAFFDEAGADFVSYGVHNLPTPETQALRVRSVPVFCWTVRSLQTAEAARPYCDQITFEGYLPS